MASNSHQSNSCSHPLMLWRQHQNTCVNSRRRSGFLFLQLCNWRTEQQCWPGALQFYLHRSRHFSGRKCYKAAATAKSLNHSKTAGKDSEVCNGCASRTPRKGYEKLISNVKKNYTKKKKTNEFSISLRASHGNYLLSLQSDFSHAGDQGVMWSFPLQSQNACL